MSRTRPVETSIHAVSAAFIVPPGEGGAPRPPVRGTRKARCVHEAPRTRPRVGKPMRLRVLEEADGGWGGCPLPDKNVERPLATDQKVRPESARDRCGTSGSCSPGSGR